MQNYHIADLLEFQIMLNEIHHAEKLRKNDHFVIGLQSLQSLEQRYQLSTAEVFVRIEQVLVESILPRQEHKILARESLPAGRANATLLYLSDCACPAKDMQAGSYHRLFDLAETDKAILQLLLLYLV